MERITTDPNIHFGKPHIVGTRITVTNVLELLNEQLTFDDILQNYYPELQKEDIQACLEYAIDLAEAKAGCRETASFDQKLKGGASFKLLS